MYIYMYNGTIYVLTGGTIEYIYEHILHVDAVHLQYIYSTSTNVHYTFYRVS